MPLITPPTSFSGVSSGLDTSGIVDKLMQIERMPQQRLDDKIAEVGARKAAWMGINGNLLSLKMAADGLKDASVWSAMSASSSDQTAVSASAEAGATAGTYRMTVARLASAEGTVSADFSSETDALGLTGTFGIAVGGTNKSITVVAADSLDTIRGKVNQAGVGVTASVVSTRPGRFSLLMQADKTGTANAIAYTDDATKQPLRGLGLLTGMGAKNVVQAAQDAQFTLNGLTFTRSTNVVADAITGVTFNLKGENAAGLSLVIQPDTATITSRIQEFVSRYNAARAAIAKQTEKGARMQGDAGLNGIANELARLGYGIVPGVGEVNSLSQVGITLQRDGSLSVNTSKLAAALAGNMAAVKTLFSSVGTGVAARFSAYLDGLTSSKGTINGLSESFDRQVQDMQQQRQRMQMALDLRQQSLKAQFTRMEQLVSRMQSQGSWLSAQVGKLTGGSGNG